jgi:Holliday junction resolvase YEN1
MSLTRGGMVLIALLSGGDYNMVRCFCCLVQLSTQAQTKAGLANCGISIGYGLARTGLGDSLLRAALELSTRELDQFLVIWRQQLRAELSTNANGQLSRNFPSIAQNVPDSFPNLEHLLLYAKPTTSWSAHSSGPGISILQVRQPNIAWLARICERRFDWERAVTGGITAKFHNVLWDGVCLRMLLEVSIFARLDCELK